MFFSTLSRMNIVTIHITKFCDPIIEYRMYAYS